VITSTKDLPESEVKVQSFIYWLRGNINWIQQVDPNKGELLSASMKAIYASWKIDKDARSGTSIAKSNAQRSYYHNDNPNVTVDETNEILEGFEENAVNYNQMELVEF
jgi:hypothetical protein